MDESSGAGHQRYHRALIEGRLTVTLPADARRKLKTCIEKYDTSLGIQRDPNDNWISNSSVVEEAILEMLSEQGWDDIPNTSTIRDGKHYEGFGHLMSHGSAPELFDFCELAMGFMGNDEREKGRVKINEIFDHINTRGASQTASSSSCTPISWA